MKIAYLNPFSGISGDMLLGALVDAGVPLTHLKRELKKIPVAGYQLTSSKVQRHGISATKVDVHLTKHAHPARTWQDVESLIRASTVSNDIAEKGLGIFKMLFHAEAKVHGVAFQKAHLHELAAVDCIVDIFGAVIGLTYLGIDQIYTSSVNVGSGTVKTEHGILPIPAPATADLLCGIPSHGSPIPCELTTPTGAAILAGLKVKSTHLPPCKPIMIAYGAGSRDIEGQPNVLRLICAESLTHTADNAIDGSAVIVETNIDDMNPQFFETIMTKLFSAGALDVWFEQIIMKKSRPGVKLCVLADKQILPIVADIILKESTSIGIRFHSVDRIMLNRKIESVSLPYGSARVKIASQGDTIMNITPEFEDLKMLSEKTGIPIKHIADDIIRQQPCIQQHSMRKKRRA